MLQPGDTGIFYRSAYRHSEAPEGYSRWSLRLLADKMVEIKYIDNISHETVRRVSCRMQVSFIILQDLKELHGLFNLFSAAISRQGQW